MKKILIPNYEYFITAWMFIFISNYFIFLLIKQFGYNKYSVIFLLIDVAGFIVFAPFAFNYVIITDKCIKLKFLFFTKMKIEIKNIVAVNIITIIRGMKIIEISDDENFADKKLKFKKHAISLLVTKKRINLIESICKVEITEFI